MGKVIIAIVAVAVVAAIIIFAPELTPFIAGALGTTTAVAAAIVTMALSIAISVAVSSVTHLVAGAPSARGGTPSVFRQTITDSFIVYGKRRVGGLLVFFHARQVGKDHYRYFTVACAGHRCQGVVRWFLGDSEVTVDGSGMVTSGAYAGAAWLWFQRGLASETANATFVSECGGKWTAAHKGSGIAAIYAKFKMTDAVVQAGMPNMTAEIKGRDEILDPRDASTGYTRNAALIFYDWLSIPRAEGGFGAYADEIPDDDWISAQANVCDETVDSEERYAIDALMTTGTPPNEIRDALIVNCAGSYAYSGGKFLMRPGYWVPPSVTLSEDDLAGAIQVSAFLGGDQAANQVQGTYIDPSGLYQGASFDTQTSGVPDSISQLDLDLAFITSRARANRIARIMLNRAQAQKAVVWPANIVGLKARALDTVQLASDRYGLSNYAFQVQAWGLSADFGVSISCREENPEIYDEPSVVTPATVPAIVQASAILTDQQAAILIGQSFAMTPTVTAADVGLTATASIGAHTRRYPDMDVTVNAGTVTGLGFEEDYFIYYDDPTRAGGAVTYHAALTPEDAGPSTTNPDRHFVAQATTPADGAVATDGTTGGTPWWRGGNNLPVIDGGGATP